MGGVRVYDDTENTPGMLASSTGDVFALGHIGFVFHLKKTVVKENMY